MKIKKLIMLALLFTLSFSIVHEYAFAYYDENHCNVAQYVAEIEAPSDHNDICDIHFEYHQSFLLSENDELPKINTYFLRVDKKESFLFKTHKTLIKPPIA